MKNHRKIPPSCPPKTPKPKKLDLDFDEKAVGDFPYYIPFGYDEWIPGYTLAEPRNTFPGDYVNGQNREKQEIHHHQIYYTTSSCNGDLYTTEDSTGYYIAEHE